MQSLPRPIEDGTVAQSIVRYCGLRLGNVSYRGLSSRREYRFGASPGNDMHYVLDEDLSRFRLLQDFEVLEEGRIDPAADAHRREEERIAALEARLHQLADQPDGSDSRSTSSSAPSSQRRGRPPVQTEENDLGWHLKHHTGGDWTASQIAKYLSARAKSRSKDAVEVTEDAVFGRLKRWKQRAKVSAECDLCRREFFPRPPEIPVKMPS